MDAFVDPLALLALQIDWGADEALAEAPVHRLLDTSRPTSAPGPGPAHGPAQGGTNVVPSVTPAAPADTSTAKASPPPAMPMPMPPRASNPEKRCRAIWIR